MRRRALALAASLCLSLSSPGGAQGASGTAELKALAEADGRVLAIAYRVQTRGAPLCARTDHLPGLSLHQLGQYPPRLRPSARELWGLDDKPTVLAVAPGSPAARAGLRAGDAIQSVDGVASDPTPDLVSLVHSLATGVPVRLVVERGGREITLVLATERGCRSRVQLVPARRARAWANGEVASLSTPLYAFLRDDHEMAFVLAHEIAHNSLGHPGVGGSVKTRELAADQLALELMAAAGYETRRVPLFLERLYRGPAGGFLSSLGHLGRRERIAAVKRAISG